MAVHVVPNLKMIFGRVGALDMFNFSVFILNISVNSLYQTMVNVLNFRALSFLPKGLDKQSRVFSVCYYGKNL